MKILALIKKLTVSEIYTLTMFLLCAVFAAVFHGRLDGAALILLKTFIISTIIFFIAGVWDRAPGSGACFLLRRLYVVPIIFLIYHLVQDYISIVSPGLWDATLIEWDRALFGLDPTVWISQFSFPALTEYLQFSYMTYFLLPVVVGVNIYYGGSDKAFDEFAGLIVLSFYLSYILYFIAPSIGPRFTLHEFSALSAELPGLLTADFFRELVNASDSIPSGIPNPAELVYRNCMPSAHTWITTIVIAVALRRRLGTRWIVCILGFSLMASTVYLRYHYVVDILAGIIFAFGTMWIEPRLRRLIEKGLKHAASQIISREF